MVINKELSISIFYILFALVFIVGGMQYPIGSLDAMGGGYWPILVGCILFVIGVLNYIRYLICRTPIIINIKIKVPLSATILLILTYLIAEYISFIIGISFLIWGSAMLHPKFNIRSTLIVNMVSIVLTIILKMTLITTLPF